MGSGADFGNRVPNLIWALVFLSFFQSDFEYGPSILVRYIMILQGFQSKGFRLRGRAGLARFEVRQSEYYAFPVLAPRCVVGFHVWVSVSFGSCPVLRSC